MQVYGTSCRRRWPVRSASSAVSKYQPPSRAAHQTVYCWQPCLSGCSTAQVWNGLPEAVVSSSWLQTFRRHLKNNSSFSTFIPSPDLWECDWHRYSGPCNNVRYLDHSKIYVYLLSSKCLHVGQVLISRRSGEGQGHRSKKTCRSFSGLTGPPGGGEGGDDPIFVNPFPQSAARARHRLTLRDQKYGDSVSRCVPV